MSRIQTRRTVSVRGDTYAALRAHADELGVSMSEVVEELLSPVLGTPGRKPPKEQPVERQEWETKKRLAERIRERKGMPAPTPPDEQMRPQDVRW